MHCDNGHLTNTKTAETWHKCHSLSGTSKHPTNNVRTSYNSTIGALQCRCSCLDLCSSNNFLQLEHVLSAGPLSCVPIELRLELLPLRLRNEGCVTITSELVATLQNNPATKKRRTQGDYLSYHNIIAFTSYFRNCNLIMYFQYMTNMQRRVTFLQATDSSTFITCIQPLKIY